MGFKKILAIKLRSLGDTIVMTAPLQALKDAYPQAELHVAVLSSWAALLEGHPAIDRLWHFEWRKDKLSRTKTVAKMGFLLRKENFDCVVNFHASPSSSTLARATGAPMRSIHFHGHSDKNRFSTVNIPGKGVLKPVIERDMDAVRALGLSVPNGKLPFIFLSGQDRAAARDYLSTHSLKSPLLVLGLGASRPTKIWPRSHFVAAAKEWQDRTQGSSIAILAPHERALAQCLHTQMQESSVKEGTLHVLIEANLRLVAAIIGEGTAFLGNDSGPKHLAVSLGVPTVTLFGPEHPYEWHPYPTDRHPYLFIENLSCRRDADPGMPAWCGLEECVAEEHKCMHLISPEEAIKHCMQVIDR